MTKFGTKVDAPYPGSKETDKVEAITTVQYKERYKQYLKNKFE